MPALRVSKERWPGGIITSAYNLTPGVYCILDVISWVLWAVHW